MNIDEKLDGMLLKCSGPAGLHHHSSRGLGSAGVDGRGGMDEMPMGERALANHPLLAEEDDEDEDLAGATLSAQHLISHDELMVHEETVKNDGEGDPGFSQRPPPKLPYSLHMPVSIHWSSAHACEHTLK